MYKLKKLLRNVVIIFSLLLPNFALAQENPDKPSLIVYPFNGEIDLDGRLDEPVWQKADSIPNLTTTEPVEGGSPNGKTIVKILAGESDIIIGIKAYDPDPAEIVSYSKQRDPHLQGEDHILIVLDTFLDGRSGYTFAVNPSGARYDALVSGQGERQSADWDAIWEAATKIESWGWSVEIKIPVRSLSFKKGLGEWGFNIQRRVQRLQESSRWASPKIDYQPTQTAKAGRITGLPDFNLGRGISIRPSIVGGTVKSDHETDVESTFEPSLDITQQIGSNVLASLSMNTDFAETDVDQRRSNLTRFPLFFPEKRTFFLEGSDIFNFGFGLGKEIIPFFSRRLGMIEGNPVPIDIGGKINGRINNTNFGVLGVRTGNGDSGVPSSNMGVVRVNQNVLEESSLGVIGAFGDPEGINGSWLTGVDFTYRTSSFKGDKNFVAGVWGLAMDRKDLEGDKSALGVVLDYPNDLWDIYLAYRRIGDGFDPSLGFVPRRGVQYYNVSIQYKPRPDWDWIRYNKNEFFNTLVTDLDGNWESYRVFTAPINVVFESGERVEFNVVAEGEQIAETFDISDVDILPGSYNWIRYRLEGDVASKRELSGRMSWWFGDFYDGTLDQYQVRINWKPSATLTMELSAERNEGRLQEGNFVQNIYGSKVRLNISPDFQINTHVQYDNESRSIGSNTRLRWTFHPLGDLFIVYNHNIRDINDRYRLDSNQFLAKFQYAFRR
ncbi:MAG: carbohydrate binding family 9 domain-containing protein [bacterium]|nr:carbohydrate binding family 9 domain-containing protein [bacterium]